MKSANLPGRAGAPIVFVNQIEGNRTLYVSVGTSTERGDVGGCWSRWSSYRSSYQRAWRLRVIAGAGWFLSRMTELRNYGSRTIWIWSCEMSCLGELGNH